MTANGQPDASRAARVVLKHYVLGRLLFNVAPPGVNQTKFHSYKLPEENRAEKTFTPFEKTLLKVFFHIFINWLWFVTQKVVSG